MPSKIYYDDESTKNANITASPEDFKPLGADFYDDFRKREEGQDVKLIIDIIDKIVKVKMPLIEFFEMTFNRYFTNNAVLEYTLEHNDNPKVLITLSLSYQINDEPATNPILKKDTIQCRLTFAVNNSFTNLKGYYQHKPDSLTDEATKYNMRVDIPFSQFAEFLEEATHRVVTFNDLFKDVHGKNIY